jgi:purine-binding chemotaxis protein CheW
MNTLAAARESISPPRVMAESEDYVTLTIDDQLFGIPVLRVQDVLSPQQVARVPLSGEEVAGSLNLRGRIVTVIDVRTRLGLPRRAEGGSGMTVVVEYEGELYSLMIDAVGEVMTLPGDRYETNPATLDPIWCQCSKGVYRLDEGLLMVLDVDRLLGFGAGST